MARDFLPPIGPNRGARVPVVALIAFVVPLVVSAGVLKLVQTRWVHPLNAQVANLRKSADSEKEKQEALQEEVDRLTRQVGALQRISRVEILWGGAEADTKRVSFPYKRSTNATFWEHPVTNETLWYYTDAGDTLAAIAAHPRVLGAAHLWPILARENGLSPSGSAQLPRGRLVRVPPRLNEFQIRGAVTEAGAPDEQRNEIFAQAGLRP